MARTERPTQAMYAAIGRTAAESARVEQNLRESEHAVWTLDDAKEVADYYQKIAGYLERFMDQTFEGVRIPLVMSRAQEENIRERWEKLMAMPGNYRATGAIPSLCSAGRCSADACIRRLSCLRLSEFRVQDALVAPAFQREGVGGALLSEVLRQAENVSQVVLVTDADLGSVPLMNLVASSRFTMRDRISSGRSSGSPNANASTMMRARAVP